MNCAVLKRVIRSYPSKIWLIGYLCDKEYARHRDRGLIRGRLIDIGCGTKPYEGFFAPHVTQHVGADHPDSRHDKSKVDILASAYAIPEADASFDSALCTAVLEHLEEPELALRECYRLLKPGGTALYSIPFIWHVHEEPRDFYRFSRYGIDYLFRKVGFERIEIVALSGFWATFGQLLVYQLYRLNKIPMAVLVIKPLAILVQVLAYGFNLVDHDERWTWMYQVVAYKPALTT